MNTHSLIYRPAMLGRGVGALRDLLLAMLVVVSQGVRSAPAEGVYERASPKAIGEWADAEFLPALADKRFSGLVITVVRAGEAPFSRGYGNANPVTGAPVLPQETRFRIGSATKVFTATAVAQLLDQGRIASLDDPANKYLKRVQLPDSGGKPITIWHLLTHRAGFEDSAFGLGARDPPDGRLAPAEEIKQMMPRLVRPAGFASVYSNYSTALLGVLVEDVSGSSIKDFFARNIFLPLGMMSTKLSDDFEPALSLGIPAATFPDGTVQTVRYLPMRTFITPAGGIITTGTDMARFMAAHIEEGAGPGPVILKPESFALMHTAKVRNHPAVSGFGMKFMAHQWNGEPVIEHGGGWPGFQTVMLMLPKKGVGVFISIMGADASSSLSEHLKNLVATTRLTPKPGLTVRPLMNALVVREDILSHLLGPWSPAAPSARPGTTNLGDYEGSYWRERRSYSSFEAMFDLFSARSAILRVERDGADALRINGVGGFRQIEKDVFWNPAARPKLDADPNTQALYAFTRDQGGVRAMTPLLSVDQWTRTSDLINPATLFSLILVIFVLGLTSFALLFWSASTGADPVDRWLPILQWILLLAVPLVLLTGYADGDSIVYRLLPGAPGRFVTLLALTNAGALVALGTVFVAWRAWRTSAWGVGWRGILRRLHYSLLAISSVCLVGCFAFFNLIGVHWP